MPGDRERGWLSLRQNQVPGLRPAPAGPRRGRTPLPARPSVCLPVPDLRRRGQDPRPRPGDQRQEAGAGPCRGAGRDLRVPLSPSQRHPLPGTTTTPQEAPPGWHLSSPPSPPPCLGRGGCPQRPHPSGSSLRHVPCWHGAGDTGVASRVARTLLGTPGRTPAHAGAPPRLFLCTHTRVCSPSNNPPHPPPRHARGSPHPLPGGSSPASCIKRCCCRGAGATGSFFCARGGTLDEGRGMPVVSPHPERCRGARHLCPPRVPPAAGAESGGGGCGDSRRWSWQRGQGHSGHRRGEFGGSWNGGVRGVTRVGMARGTRRALGATSPSGPLACSSRQQGDEEQGGLSCVQIQPGGCGAAVGPLVSPVKPPRCPLGWAG